MDESLDRRARYLCLGALFLPDDGPTNAQMEDIKDQYRRFAPGHSFSDVKYSKSGDNFTFDICREIIALFSNSSAWFRALVIDTSLPEFSWRNFGGRTESRRLTRVLAYNRLAELRLRPNLQGISNAILLADSMTAVAGDDFVQHIYRSFGVPFGSTEPTLPQIRYVERVDISLPRYQLGQMCDVLLGVITGDLVRPTNRNKLALIQYAKESLAIPDFSPDYWLGLIERQPGELPLKFHVWHWRPT